MSPVTLKAYKRAGLIPAEPTKDAFAPLPIERFWTPLQKKGN